MNQSSQLSLNRVRSQFLDDFFAALYFQPRKYIYAIYASRHHHSRQPELFFSTKKAKIKFVFLNFPKPKWGIKLLFCCVLTHAAYTVPQSNASGPSIINGADDAEKCGRWINCVLLNVHLFDLCSENKGCCAPTKNTVSYCRIGPRSPLKLLKELEETGKRWNWWNCYCLLKVVNSYKLSLF